MRNTKRNTTLLKLLAVAFIVILISHALSLENVQAYNSSGYNFYNQLNITEKTIYNKLKNITLSDTNVDLSNIYKGNTYIKDDFMNMLSANINNSMDALLKDYPEIFWLEGWEYSYQYTTSANSNEIRITGVKLTQIVKDVYTNNGDAMINEMMNVINNFKASGSTRYEKVKYIHDWLADNIEYDGNNPYAHEPYGALVKGKSVCEGYAEAFKLLCDKYSIPTILVVGEGINSNNQKEAHMWNYVQMEDGKWYAVDVTWDDQKSKIYYDFFLVGANSIPEHFRKLKYSESHIIVEDLQIPTLSPHAYDPNTPSNTPTKTPNKTPSPKTTPTPKVTQTPIETSTPKKTAESSTKSPKPSATKPPAPSTTTNTPKEISPSASATATPTPEAIETQYPENNASQETINNTPTMKPSETPISETKDNTTSENTSEPAIATPINIPNKVAPLLIIVLLVIVVIAIVFLKINKARNNK